MASGGSRDGTVLLDVNGTLTDPAAIGAIWDRPRLGDEVLGHAVQTSMVDALLGVADRPFSDHLRSAIEVVVAADGLDASRIGDALSAVSSLPARPDARGALSTLAGAGLRLVALTNSGAEAGRRTLEGCGLLDLVSRVLGVDAVKTFKPDPAVYAYALDELDRPAADVVLLATHPWDLAGAAHAGMDTAWVRHGARGWPAVFAAPTVTGETLADVAERLAAGAG